MTTRFYLHVKENGAVRATKTKVATFVDEITLAMTINLPERLFKKPVISGEITVTDEMVKPTEIQAEVIDEIKEAISSVKSVELHLNIPDEN